MHRVAKIVGNLAIEDGYNDTKPNGVGYESPTQFSREFTRHYGSSPREYIRK